MLNKKNNNDRDDRTPRRCHDSIMIIKKKGGNVKSGIELENRHFATPDVIISLVNNIDGFENHWVNGCWQTENSHDLKVYLHRLSTKRKMPPFNGGFQPSSPHPSDGAYL